MSLGNCRKGAKGLFHFPSSVPCRFAFCGLALVENCCRASPFRGLLFRREPACHQIKVVAQRQDRRASGQHDDDSTAAGQEPMLFRSEIADIDLVQTFQEPPDSFRAPCNPMLRLWRLLAGLRLLHGQLNTLAHPLRPGHRFPWRSGRGLPPDASMLRTRLETRLLDPRPRRRWRCSLPVIFRSVNTRRRARSARAGRTPSG